MILTLNKLSIVTLVAVYLLILVGGIVRSTGSGMGCPDWPKCFGSWIPPTEESQLPSSYQQVYVQQRADKNERFARYLGVLGFTNLAQEIQHDSSILEPEDFNATKTWIEYLNRLLGAVVGALIFATFVASLKFFKKDRTVTLIAWATLITVGIQGWIGSVVVSTNLLPWMITVHMLLALLIVALLTYLVVRISPSSKVVQTSNSSNQKRIYQTVGIILTTLLVLTLVQIVMGTQVRESVNEVSSALGEAQRNQWIAGLDWVFYVHRSYSLVVLAGHLYLWYFLYKNFRERRNLMRWAKVLCVIIVAEILTGTVMAYFAIPRLAQPLHLIFATLAFGLQFYLLLLTFQLKQYAEHLTQETRYVSY